MIWDDCCFKINFILESANFTQKQQIKRKPVLRLNSDIRRDSMRKNPAIKKMIGAVESVSTLTWTLYNIFKLGCSLVQQANKSSVAWAMHRRIIYLYLSLTHRQSWPKDLRMTHIHFHKVCCLSLYDGNLNILQNVMKSDQINCKVPFCHANELYPPKKHFHCISSLPQKDQLTCQWCSR